MNYKFLNHSTGLAKPVADYLTGLYDYKGKKREGVEILRGDPYAVAVMADSLPYVHKYTSGIISFAPTDDPSDAKINEVLTEWELTAFSGLDKSRYLWSAVLHRQENGGCHIHVFVARRELQSGKSFNIAPPGRKTQKKYDSWRDYFNMKEGWARPENGDRARNLQPTKQSYITEEKLKAGLSVEPDPRQLLHNFIMQEIFGGRIVDREDIINFLHEKGYETPRVGATYISIKNPFTDKNIRLKGRIYNADFDAVPYLEELTSDKVIDPRRNEKPNTKKAAEKWEELQEHRSYWRKYNLKTYGANRRLIVDTEKKAVVDTEKETTEESSFSGKPVGPTRIIFKKTLALAFLNVQNGVYVWQNRPQLRAFVDCGNRIFFSTKNPTAIKAGVQLAWEKGWKTLNIKSSDKDFCLISYREARKQGFQADRITFQKYKPDPKDLQKIEEELNHGINRNRTSTNTDCDRIAGRASQNYLRLAKNNRRAGKNHQRLKQLCEELDRSNRYIDRSCRHLNSSIQRFKPGDLKRAWRDRMDRELDRFKENINLVEYAVSRGFAVVTGKSSKSSTYLQNGNRIKIGISRHRSTDQDVFNDFTRGEGYCGTIIDFIQKIEGVHNFGEVRKTLRAYIGSPPPQIRYPRPAPRQTPAEQAKALNAEKEATRPLEESAYLESQGIPLWLLHDPRFKGMLRTDKNNNVLFMHLNKHGYSGSEKENNYFTGFSRNGEKGVWACRPPADLKRIVFCESGINALSHSVLFPDPQAAYVSIAGQISVEQEDLIQGIIDRNLKRDPDFEFVAAFDNDAVGQRYAADLKRLAVDHPLTVETPTNRDWNDDLQAALKQQQEQQKLTL